MIEFERVSYSYPGAGRPALRDLSLAIGEGEFVLVCGPSGAGKSTLLRLINGLVPHFHGGALAGDVRAWGRSIRSHQPRDMADLVGFVFQDPEAQLVVDIVEDELAFAMENLGLPPRLMRRRVEEVLDQLGIAHLRHRQIAQLSGGERQRVAIARATVMAPKLLLADEPTGNLDTGSGGQVLAMLDELNHSGLTLVVVTHDPNVARRARRVVVLVDGRVALRVPGERVEEAVAALLTPAASAEAHG